MAEVALLRRWELKEDSEARGFLDDICIDVSVMSVTRGGRLLPALPSSSEKYSMSSEKVFFVAEGTKKFRERRLNSGLAAATRSP